MARLITTSVTGEVKEYHYRCPAHHEFSVMVKPELEMSNVIPCPVGACSGLAELIGDNDAEVSKRASELLAN